MDVVEQTGESAVANKEPKFPMNDCAEACAGVRTRELMEQVTEEVRENEKKSVYAGFMERWPILFQQKDQPMTRTCMCWGIECPPGWKSILERLCNKLETINLTTGKQWEFEIQAVQVKEKFATLRFYFDIVNKSDDEQL